MEFAAGGSPSVSGEAASGIKRRAKSKTRCQKQTRLSSRRHLRQSTRASCRAYCQPGSGVAKAAELAFRAAETGFADMQLHIDDLIAEGDKVVTHWTMHGMHKGEAVHPRLGAVKPTHKLIKVSGTTIHQIQNGMVIHSWGETNELGGLEQLGLVEEFAKAIQPLHR
jgi:predicted ester cyclase